MYLNDELLSKLNNIKVPDRVPDGESPADAPEYTIYGFLSDELCRLYLLGRQVNEEHDRNARQQQRLILDIQEIKDPDLRARLYGQLEDLARTGTLLFAETMLLHDVYRFELMWEFRLLLGKKIHLFPDWSLRWCEPSREATSDAAYRVEEITIKRRSG